MVVRSCLVLLFLLGVVGQCAARRNYRQTSRLLMRTPQEHSGSVLLHRQFVQHNIVARDFLPQRPLWEVALEMNLKQHDTALISPLFLQKTQEYALVGHWEYIQSERTYFGDFRGGYSSFGSLKGAKSPHADYFYPYLVLDTTRSAIHAWNANVAFGHIWRTRQWIFGVAGECKVNRTLAEGAIQHLTKGLELSLREGVYVWVDDYWLGQWAAFSYYWQWLNLVSQIGAKPFYRHLGFGLWNWDRTVAAEAMSFENKTGQVAAGLQVSARDEGLVADIHGAHRWMSHADKDYLAAASSERQDLSARLGYKLELGESTTELLADFRLQNRTGVEHFYDSVGPRGNKRYDRLFASPMYTQVARLLGESLACELPIHTGYLWGRLFGGYGIYRSKYENPENKYRFSYWRCELEVGYLFRRHHDWFSFQLLCVWQPLLEKERQFSPHVKEPLKSSFLLPMLEYNEATRIEPRLRLEYGYKLPRSFTLIAEPHLGLASFLGLGYEFYGGLVLRICKE